MKENDQEERIETLLRHSFRYELFLREKLSVYVSFSQDRVLFIFGPTNTSLFKTARFFIILLIWGFMVPNRARSF